MIENPTKELFGLTWVGWLNAMILQWLGMRLGYGDRWRVILGVWPLTGWFKNGSKHYARACRKRSWPKNDSV